MLSIDEFRVLHVDGHKIGLSRCQVIIMELLLPGRLVSYEVIEDALWPLDADRESVAPRDTIKSHITHIRARLRATPLIFRNISGLGYQLESTMTDTKSRPIIDNAIKAVRGALKESSISDGLEAGDIVYHDDGSASTHHSNKQVDIDVVVTPKTVTGGTTP